MTPEIRRVCATPTQPRHTTPHQPAESCSNRFRDASEHGDHSRRHPRKHHADERQEGRHVPLHDASAEDPAVVVEARHAARASSAMVDATVLARRSPDQTSDAVGTQGGVARRPGDVLESVQGPVLTQPLFHLRGDGVA
eukprot:CAMPEP_0183401076 /NCGR_PEP_ID=MMETSP0370-20130417/13030_1 /TAXON_ID=268820 /ORGANISM="Peridinium aciculiferum, Strain PAER-2" /LENGTH=138 /DNA_ID=CAMNT_0025582489 /DNA_START=16 /DNA_END=429 /DNA_ORIENTATION=+